MIFLDNIGLGTLRAWAKNLFASKTELSAKLDKTFAKSAQTMPNFTEPSTVVQYVGTYRDDVQPISSTVYPLPFYTINPATGVRSVQVLDIPSANENDAGVMTAAMLAQLNAATQDIASEIARAPAAEAGLVPRNISPSLLTSATIEQTQMSVNIDVGYVLPGNGITGSQQTVLPMASETVAGMMAAEDKQTLNQHTSDIQALKESGGGWLGSFATKAALDSFVFPATAAPGDVASVETDETHDGATTQYRVMESGNGELTWVFDMVKTIAPVPIASQTVHGIVRGVDANGKVYIESDGTMSWVGFNDISAALANLQDALQNAGQQLAQKANASDLTAHTSNATVHITAAERTAWNSAQVMTAVTSGALSGVSTLNQLTARLNSIFAGTYAIGGINVS